MSNVGKGVVYHRYSYPAGGIAILESSLETNM